MLITFVFLKLHLHRGDGKKVLRSLIPSDILPPEYGGCGPSVEFLLSMFSFHMISCLF